MVKTPNLAHPLFFLSEGGQAIHQTNHLKHIGPFFPKAALRAASRITIFYVHGMMAITVMMVG